jgi:hypothetical protein
MNDLYEKLLKAKKVNIYWNKKLLFSEVIIVFVELHRTRYLETIILTFQDMFYPLTIKDHEANSFEFKDA